MNDANEKRNEMWKTGIEMKRILDQSVAVVIVTKLL